MKNLSLFILLKIILIPVLFSQNTQIKYYRNETLGREVSERRARVSLTIKTCPDSITTFEVRNIRSGYIVSRQLYAGNEPIGQGFFRRGDQVVALDYDFRLGYNEQEHRGSIQGINPGLYFQPNEDLEYIPPGLTPDYENIEQFLSENLSYPLFARHNELTGTVLVEFTITKAAEVKNVNIVRGVDASLDKEVVRVFRKLKLSSPARINGQATEVLAVHSIRFIP